MKLHFLGTSGYHPNNLRQTACLMLPELGVILDAGTGLFRVSDLIETEHLDILLTHTHLDHVIGLTFLYDVLQSRDISVTVHVAEPKVSIIQERLFDPLLFPVRPNFRVQPFKEEVIRLHNGAKVEAIALQHPGGSHGFRFDQDTCSLAYITDTTAHIEAPYVNQIQGVATLIHECYFPDGHEEKAALTGHSCLTPVAQVAARAGINRGFLVHINPLNESDEPLDLDSVKSIHANLAVPFDGQVIEV
ncbi:MAG: MBL fold metallo-hydrolase [Planctomycetota bacterium]|nr:MBL fold metallo-hydrolase [Planctomycetota bacterium]